jgi:hypothetical protein
LSPLTMKWSLTPRRHEPGGHPPPGSLAPVLQKEKQMKFLGILAALALTLLAAPGAFPDVGGNSGGGGVFIELDVLAVQTLLKDNCDVFESFKKHQVDCQQFRQKLEEVGLPGQGLSIEDGSLFLGNGKQVDAINYAPARVKIGASGWEMAGDDVALKVGLQAHEFLSLMKIEHTGYYPVSRDLVNELRTSPHFASLTTTRSNPLAWVRSQFSKGNEMKYDFPGTDALTGKRCALFLTNRSWGTSEDYYIVTGFLEAQQPEDYVGVVASQSAGSASEGGINLNSDQPWGNKSKFNTVSIKINLFGKPLRADGESDLRKVQCVLD